MIPTPPSTTTTTPASASSLPRLRPDPPDAAASAVGVGSSVPVDSSKDGRTTGTWLTLIVGSTGSGRVEVVSSGVSRGSGVRDRGGSDSIGKGDSVGSGLGTRVRDGLGLAVSVGQTMTPQVGRGVGVRDGLGEALGSSDCDGSGSPESDGDGVSWTWPAATAGRSASRAAAVGASPARPARETAASSHAPAADRRTPLLLDDSPTSRIVVSGSTAEGGPENFSDPVNQPPRLRVVPGMISTMAGEAGAAPTAAWSDADDALVGLYRAHYRSLVRLAALLLDDLGTSEEVVQDAFIKMHLGWGRLRDPDKALAYLRQTVVNLSRSRMRRRQVAARHAPKPMPDGASAEYDAIGLAALSRHLEPFS